MMISTLASTDDVMRLLGFEAMSDNLYVRAGVRVERMRPGRPPQQVWGASGRSGRLMTGGRLPRPKRFKSPVDAALAAFWKWGAAL